MDGGSLVFNASYRSLAAEWLGITPNQQTNRADSELEEDSLKEHVLLEDKPKKHKQKLKPEKKKEEREKLSVEVGQKLGKKLLKAKKRAHERVEVEKDNTEHAQKKDEVSDEEEDSKIDMVKKMRLQHGSSKSLSKPLTVAEITKKLKDATLSKPCRKRLKKKLRQLQEKNEVSPPRNTSNQQTQLNSKPSPLRNEARLKSKEIDDFSRKFMSDLQRSNSVNKVKSDIKDERNERKHKSDSDNNSTNAVKGSEDMFTVDRAGNKTLSSPSKKRTQKKKSSFSMSSDSNNCPKTSKKFTNLKTKDKLNGKVGNKQSEDNVNLGKGDDKKKRKRHKSRSKQKNIKKDHRPDSEKPAYLKGVGSKRVNKTLSQADLSDS